MRCSFWFPLFCLLMLVACTSTGGDGGARQTNENGALATEDGLVQPQEAGLTNTSAQEERRANDLELSLWRDPKFRRWLVESYAAETEIEPRITIVEQDEMDEVVDLIAQNQMTQAIQKLEGRRGEATSAVFDFLLGQLYFQSDEFEKALHSYRIATDKFPKFRRAWRMNGLTNVRLGNLADALPALTKVIELGGGDAITYGLLGFAHASNGNALSAETAYRTAMLLEPETLDFKLGLARSLFRQRRYAESVALLDELIERQPQNADLWTLQAGAYIGLNEPMKAVENYEFVDQLGASTAATLQNLADIYRNQELFDLSVETYVRAMETEEPIELERIVLAARYMTSRGFYEETHELLNGLMRTRGETLELQEKAEVERLRAGLALAEGNREQEEEALKKIVEELDPSDGQALILLGNYYRRRHDDLPEAERQGELQQAIFYFERAAAIESSEAEAKLAHAQLLVSQGDYKKAIPLLERHQAIKASAKVEEFLEKVREAAAQSR